MRKRKTIIGGVAVIVLVFAAAWAFGFFRRSDPAVSELQQLGSQAWDRSLPEAQRNELRDQFRQRMGSLTDDQRRAFFDANRDRWTGQMQQRMDEFFKMSKSDQQKRLDEILNRMTQARSSQQQNQSKAGANNRGPRNMTDSQREERSKRRLDRTTPAMRAQMTEFRHMLGDRAQQRGISVGSGSGPGMRGGGWRGA
jgi:hypothetical protein